MLGHRTHGIRHDSYRRRTLQAHALVAPRHEHLRGESSSLQHRGTRCVEKKSSGIKKKKKKKARPPGQAASGSLPVQSQRPYPTPQALPSLHGREGAPARPNSCHGGSARDLPGVRAGQPPPAARERHPSRRRPAGTPRPAAGGPGREGCARGKGPAGEPGVGQAGPNRAAGSAQGCWGRGAAPARGEAAPSPPPGRRRRRRRRDGRGGRRKAPLGRPTRPPALTHRSAAAPRPAAPGPRHPADRRHRRRRHCPAGRAPRRRGSRARQPTAADARRVPGRDVGKTRPPA